MSALEDQPGGDHYRKHKIQPIEYITANELGFIEGNIVKYATRHQDKGGAADVRKIIHYAQLLLELKYGEPQCQVDTTPSTLPPSRKPRGRSKSARNETKPDMTSNEPEKSTKETDSTSTIDALLRRVAATNQAIGGFDPGTQTVPKGTLMQNDVPYNMAAG